MLVKPLGFQVSDRMLKRACLDYWEGVNVAFLEDLEEYLNSVKTSFYFFSSKSKKYYTEVSYQPSDHLIFGSETTGLPLSFREKWPERFLTIPMKEGARCLNLSNAASVVLYEAWRQQNFL
jgi:tRNA (cytidine/uridine-2'-O-)-methyltransferase